VSVPVRVLYLDDDAALGQLMRRALAPRRVEVDPVTDPDRALEMLQSTAYDLIALDHDLGSTTGLQMLPRIRAMKGTPPVIYVTGSEDARIAVAALKAGAVDYVWKDVEGHYRELFGEAINSALAQENLRREKEYAERQMREAKERAETLLGEVNHRVANSLALVAGLALMQASTVADENSKSVLREMQIRIQAIAGIHRRPGTGYASTSNRTSASRRIRRYRSASS
jgi:DNA-binding response OmpR family regulator